MKTAQRSFSFAILLTFGLAVESICDLNLVLIAVSRSGSSTLFEVNNVHPFY